MTRISKGIVVLGMAAFCGVFLAGISVAPTAEAQEKGEQAKDQYEDSRVLVEAFVVEVKLEALYESGVSPIGQRPNSVSIDSIVQCLKDKDTGRVTTGAKLAVKQKEDGSFEEEKTKYVAREQEVGVRKGTAAGKKGINHYTMGTTFRATAVAGRESRIVVEFSFNQSGFDFSKKPMLPDKINRRWVGTVSLEAGKPSIVGATQDEETAVFLILCADIEYK